MRANVKPLTHWIIYKGYSVRFHERSPERVTGLLTTPEGALNFEYNPQTLQICLPQQSIQINDYGWELAQSATGHSTTIRPSDE